MLYSLAFNGTVLVKADAAVSGNFFVGRAVPDHCIPVLNVDTFVYPTTMESRPADKRKACLVVCHSPPKGVTPMSLLAVAPQVAFKSSRLSLWLSASMLQ